MNFGKLSVRCQILLLYISVSFLLSICAILLSIQQLDWKRSSITSLMSDSLDDFFTKKLTNYLEEDGEFIKRYFQRHMHSAALLSEVFEGVFELSPVDPGEVHWSKDEQLTQSFEHGAFFSEVPISPEGEALMNTASAMDKIFPSLYDSSYDLIYAGFMTDQLFYFYPADYFNVAGYTPYRREWFYKAIDNPGEIQITDPYEDPEYEGLFFLSFSRAILHDGETIGVGSIDIVFQEIAEIFSQDRLGDFAFELLVSQNGILFGIPSAWKSNESIVRIDEESITGISTEMWENIKDPNTDYQLMEFTDTNDFVYKFIKKGIAPYEDDPGKVTHFLMVCLDNRAFTDRNEEYEEDYNKLFYMVLWTILAIQVASLMIILLVVIYYSGKITKSFRALIQFVKELNLKSHLPNTTETVSTEAIRSIKKDFTDLYYASKAKKLDMMNEERFHSAFDWQGIRPSDLTLYDNWRQMMYPVNKYKEQKLGLSVVLDKLKKIN